MEKGNKGNTLLSHEESVNLIKLAQAGDEEAKSILIDKNIGLVKSVLRGLPTGI